MKYDRKHYEKVAKLYARYGTVAKVQDHYPWTTYSTVARWVRKARDLELLPAKT